MRWMTKKDSIEDSRLTGAKIKMGVAMGAAMTILLVFLMSEPLRLAWGFLLKTDFKFDAQWSATLNNMVMIAVGVLLGTSGRTQDAQRPSSFRTRKEDVPELTDEVETKTK